MKEYICVENCKEDIEEILKHYNCELVIDRNRNLGIYYKDTTETMRLDCEFYNGYL